MEKYNLELWPIALTFCFPASVFLFFQLVLPTVDFLQCWIGKNPMPRVGSFSIQSKSQAWQSEYRKNEPNESNWTKSDPSNREPVSRIIMSSSPTIYGHLHGNNESTGQWA